MKTSFVLLSVLVSACATASDELADIQDIEALFSKADELAPACLVQIEQPTICGFAHCQWSESFEQCLGDENTIADIVLRRRSFNKASCVAFDDALQPALAPLNRCVTDTAMESDPKSENLCRDYLRTLTSSCAGYTGYVLGVNDTQLSEKFREEMTSEVPNSDTLEQIESRLVRYRPEK